MKIDNDNIPVHIAIIMDGNGRWARSRNLPVAVGHAEGVKTVQRIIEHSKKIGVKILTLYAFSSENWKRSEDEVNALMKLLESYLKQNIVKMKEDGVRFNAIGDIEKMPDLVRSLISKGVEETKANSRFTLNVALNYGGRQEIVRAVKRILTDNKQGKIIADELNEEMFSRYLYTADLPDPDLLIRTSGEMRISNFLLWQISYSEIYVTKTLWPDFNEEEYEKAIIDFQGRARRFGGR